MSELQKRHMAIGYSMFWECSCGDKGDVPLGGSARAAAKLHMDAANDVQERMKEMEENPLSIFKGAMS